MHTMNTLGQSQAEAALKHKYSTGLQRLQWVVTRHTLSRGWGWTKGRAAGLRCNKAENSLHQGKPQFRCPSLSAISQLAPRPGTTQLWQVVKPSLDFFLFPRAGISRSFRSELRCQRPPESGSGRRELAGALCEHS